MPGRGRGRGLKSSVVPSQPASAEQLALLKADHPPPIKNQFDDAPNDSSDTNHDKDLTLDSVNDKDSSSPVSSSKDPPSSTNSKEDSVSSKDPTPDKVISKDTSSTTLKSWNVNAPEFVPMSKEIQLSVGGASLEQLSEPIPYTETSEDDILNSFERKTTGEHPLLRSAATMLLEASSYPASFDTHLSILSHLIDNTTITSDLLSDIAEMLVTLGIGDDSLRYTAIKMNDFLCKLSTKDTFRPLLFAKLQARYSALKSVKYSPDDDITELIETTLYIAEMFHRVRVNGQVVWVLGSAALDLVFMLVEHHTNESIIKACNVIKLIGYLLQYKTPKKGAFNPVRKLEEVKDLLRGLSVDESLSSHASVVILSVMTLSGSYWGVGKPPSHKPAQAVTISDAPVVKEEDWSEYVDESGYVIEGEDYREPTICFGDQDDPNIDEELMREYEDFVQDFEDHLMMQEFGQS